MKKAAIIPARHAFRIVLLALLPFCLLNVQTARAQTADTVLLNGKVVTVDASVPQGQAIAIRDGRIEAVGTTAAIRRLAGPQTRVIELAGRTVIPGLIDSHIHAIRAGLSFGTEVNWIGAASLTEALARIRIAAQISKPNSWLIVAGGWNPLQFAEKRLPTQREISAAAPGRLVYVQLGYAWAVLSPEGLDALQLRSDLDLPPGDHFERDATGGAAGDPTAGPATGPATGMTGAIEGTFPGIVALFAKLPPPALEDGVIGTRKFFRELNRLALTGVIDPGGMNLAPPQYQPLFRVWREGGLTVRVAFSISSQTRGTDLADYQALTTFLPRGFGDDMLRFQGIGEQVTPGMYNNDRPSDAQKAEFYEVARWAAGRGLVVTIHWMNDKSVDELLTVLERLNREVPITGLRWSIAHLNDASELSLSRMKALGIGWALQDAMYLEGDASLAQIGPEAARRTPPVVTARRLGVSVGMGTDAHRVASYNPFTALQWLLDGKTVGGQAIRAPGEIPGREEALRLYTLGSAWFSGDDDRRGSLAPGKWADLAVLSKDYMTIPVAEIGGIESLLTMVGGKIVYAAGPYARQERTLDRPLEQPLEQPLK